MPTLLSILRLSCCKISYETVVGVLKQNVSCNSLEARKFHKELFTPPRLKRDYEYGAHKVVFIGKGYLKNDKDIEYYKEYKKCIFKGDVFHSIKSVWTNYCHNKKKNNEYYFKISNIIISSEKPFNLLHIDQIESENIVNNNLISISDVNCKVMHLLAGTTKR
ncbi:hypothetical protein TSAR_003548 [Trichomalopsis sarcophagae]|uniref:Uncharacterized protein n=1 Tax=Trichomalopsis sarcophagae TaxID=543379 RepID=A0A232EQF6_9HYME|nr:hypothetical protein TSAR_003548 [Trichomalopsis sarcophagae]